MDDYWKTNLWIEKTEDDCWRVHEAKPEWDHDEKKWDDSGCLIEICDEGTQVFRSISGVEDLEPEQVAAITVETLTVETRPELDAEELRGKVERLERILKNRDETVEYQADTINKQQEQVKGMRSELVAVKGQSAEKDREIEKLQGEVARHVDAQREMENRIAKLEGALPEQQKADLDGVPL